MMRITSTLIWLRKLSEMKAEGSEDTKRIPVCRPLSPQGKSENHYLGHHSKTTCRKIVYGGHMFFPECVENDLIGCYS